MLLANFSSAKDMCSEEEMILSQDIPFVCAPLSFSGGFGIWRDILSLSVKPRFLLKARSSETLFWKLNCCSFHFSSNNPGTS